MNIEAPAKLDIKTKRLINRLRPGDIAIIDHDDLDEMAAISLVDKQIKAVINYGKSISGKYPNKGPSILCKANIFIFDIVWGNPFKEVREDSIIKIIGNKVFYGEKLVIKVELLTDKKIERLLEIAEKNIEMELNKFIDNTLTYASKEKHIISNDLEIPQIKTNMKDKHVLIVIRGQNYEKDLKAILSYIEDVEPVLIGVDGGGDALLKFGLIPNIIIGDMDSVSDECLKKCDEVIVHAYTGGEAPGMKRIKSLGLEATIFPAPGTSEDIAMLLSYYKGADLIVTVGSHSNMIDFLEKGRSGMASTFLVRMKIGSKLVDARGVSKLYKNSIKFKYIIWLILAAFLPIIMVMTISQPIKDILRLINIRLKLILGP